MVVQTEPFSITILHLFVSYLFWFMGTCRKSICSDPISADPLNVSYFAENGGCKYPISLQVTCCKSYSCKWQKIAVRGFAANCLNLGSPQKPSRCKRICWKCPYTVLVIFYATNNRVRIFK